MCIELHVDRSTYANNQPVKIALQLDVLLIVQSNIRFSLFIQWCVNMHIRERECARARITIRDRLEIFGTLAHVHRSASNHTHTQNALLHI